MRIEKNSDGTYRKRVNDLERRILELIYTEHDSVANSQNNLAAELADLTHTLTELQAEVTIIRNGGGSGGSGGSGGGVIPLAKLEELHNLVTITETGTTTSIPIGIPGFSRADDILQIYHENLRLYEGDQWIFGTDNNSIVLQGYSLSFADKIMIYVIKGKEVVSSSGRIGRLKELHNLAVITGAYTTTIPIGIPDFNRTDDILEVYHENLRLYEDEDWEFDFDGHSIILQGFTLDIGEKVMFYALIGEEPIGGGGTGVGGIVNIDQVIALLASLGVMLKSVYDANNNGIVDRVPFSGVQDKPNTLIGYGIIDSATSSDLAALRLSVATYTHNQIVASNSWSITHNLGRHPNVIIEDTGGTIVVGDITYNDMNSLTISFSPSFSGKAYLN